MQQFTSVIVVFHIIVTVLKQFFLILFFSMKYMITLIQNQSSGSDSRFAFHTIICMLYKGYHMIAQI